ncbi:uncharacterized protein LOC107263387 [Cephus cinctus]|uniref:Uncharacterized protein LOC107263387 n=1 Tax=Cephus cinctus TaxID=211228 RepID=A0AAJ7FD85_CEPCN|nr:uncharacterized protein LOC107263387 [Cephus cinctus]
MPQRKSSTAFGARDRPAPKLKEQYLFLLEFFVHHITGERLAKLNQMFFVPTSVCFQFLDFKDEDIQVTPVDPMFEPQAGIADDVEYFYSGRSIMFAIAEHVVINDISEFKIQLIVQKKMPDDIKPDILIGKGTIDLSEQFRKLKKEMQQCWTRRIPTPRTYEDEIPLNFQGEDVGTILLYVRLSAFGQTIITEFDAPPIGREKTSSFVFKGDENIEKAPTYKCRLIDSDDLNICNDSNDDVTQEHICPICVPPRHQCIPCGRSKGAVEKIPMPITPVCPAVKSVPKALEDAACTKPEKNLPIQSSRGPAQPCGKAVVLKVSGLLDEGTKDGQLKQPTVTVTSEAEATGPNHPGDPDHDVFVLRIGKKGLVGDGEKSDIQLEMRTPKGPERRPPIRYETREVQTEEDKSKGKGGKGKGKKGDKKKK